MTTDSEWRLLCDLAQLPAHFPDWDTAQRHANHDAIDEAIAAWTSNVGQSELMELLQGRGIIAAAVLDAPGMIADPHLQARGFWVEMEQPQWGRPFPFAALPVHFDRTPETYRRAGPALGEHNAEVLREVGLDDVSIAELEQIGVLASQPAE